MGRERRFIPAGDIEVRAEDGESPVIAGHSAIFNKWTDIGLFDERVLPGAFAEVLKTSDTRSLFNHDGNYVLGRKSAGTLRLKEDETGLFMENDPPGTQWANDLMVSINRGDIREQSYGFLVPADEEYEVWGHRTVGGERRETRTIKKFKELFDVGPQTWPAEGRTDISIRQAADELYEQRAKKFEEHAEAEAAVEDAPEVQGDQPERMTTRGNNLVIREHELVLGGESA